MSFLAPLGAAASSLVGGAGGLGSTLSAVGSIFSGVSAFAASMQQAKIAKQNAANADLNARRATQSASEQQIQSDNEIAAFMGQQEAIQSASGLSTTGRSQLLTRRSAARIGRQDARNIVEQGRANARGFFQQGADFRAQASAARSSAFSGLVSTAIGGATSLIGNAPPSRSPLARRFNTTSDPWIGLR